MKLEEFLRNKANILVALSIFLLLTFELVTSKTTMNLPLASISAAISYFLLFAIIYFPENYSFGVLLLNALISLFTVTFCLWVIFNIFLDISNPLNFAIIIWIVLMLGPGIRMGYLAKKVKSNYSIVLFFKLLISKLKNSPSSHKSL